AAHEPFRVRWRPLQDPLPWLDPLQLPCPARPETLGVLRRPRVDAGVGRVVPLAELRRRREAPLLAKQRFQGLLTKRHVRSPSVGPVVRASYALRPHGGNNGAGSRVFTGAETVARLQKGAGKAERRAR